MHLLHINIVFDLLCRFHLFKMLSLPVYMFILSGDNDYRLFKVNDELFYVLL